MKEFMILITALVFSFVVTYGLALLGAPQSVWIMELIGVM